MSKTLNRNISAKRKREDNDNMVAKWRKMKISKKAVKIISIISSIMVRIRAADQAAGLHLLSPAFCA
jgi:hypothetical protein